MTVKACRAATFCLSISKPLSPLSLRTRLIVPYMLGLGVISFSISMSLFFFCFSTGKKKIERKDVEFFFLLIAFHILDMFLHDISVHCALIEYAYI
jgi:hypothetical protein